MEQANRKEAPFLIQIGGTPGVTTQMSTEDFIAGSREQLEHVADVVDSAAAAFLRRLDGISIKPAEISLEFGVNVGGEAGIPFVTKGTVGANFKINVTWKPE